MAVLKSINELSEGDRIAKDVHSALGGLIMKKGKVVGPKDIAFLKGFQIQQVTVEQKDDGSKKGTSADERKEEIKPKRSPVEIEFYKLSEEVYKAFLQVKGGGNFPLLNVRRLFQPLVEKVFAQPGLMVKLQTLAKGQMYDAQHAVIVGLLAGLLARWARIPENEHMQVALAGLLHDIGKVKVDPRVTTKKGTLTMEEFEEMKTHTVNGYYILTTTAGLNEGVAFAALQHHERMDGSGYPLGLKGEQIHLYSRVVAILEVYHAMISEREYKSAMSPFIVADHLLKENLGKLDPQLVYTFVQGIMPLYQGYHVRLNNGEVGKIVFIDKNNPTRPMVQVYERFVNLVEQPKYKIDEIVDV